MPLFQALLALPALLGLVLGYTKRWEFLWIGVLGSIVVTFGWLAIQHGDPANIFFTDGHDWMLLAAAWWLLSFYGGYAVGRLLRLLFETESDADVR